MKFIPCEAALEKVKTEYGKYISIVIEDLTKTDDSRVKAYT